MTRVVLKAGGGIATGAAAQIRALAATGAEVCVVHGAGPQISDAMRSRGLEVRFVGGRRYTSEAALAIVRESLLDVNRALCTAIGPLALGLVGDAIGLEAAPVPELGLVGEPLAVRPARVERALAEGRVPVVAPIAVGPLNVNADDAAAALAVGLGADAIVFVSDVPGVLLDGAVVQALAADEAERLLDRDELEGGIVPKLHAAVRAARLGVRASIGETRVVV